MRIQSGLKKKMKKMMKMMNSEYYIGKSTSLKTKRLSLQEPPVVVSVARRDAHCEPIDSVIVSARVLW